MFASNLRLACVIQDLPSDLHTGMHPGFDDRVSLETSNPRRDLGLALEWVVQSYSIPSSRK
jgi:hypothetical protein